MASRSATGSITVRQLYHNSTFTTDEEAVDVPVGILSVGKKPDWRLTATLMSRLRRYPICRSLSGFVTSIPLTARESEQQRQGK